MKNKQPLLFPRRAFLGSLTVAGAVLLADWRKAVAALAPVNKQALTFPHFGDPFLAFVWRNWQLVPAERLAAVTGATLQQLQQTAAAMGLPAAPAVTAGQLGRSYITIIRRNWHLLPKEQLLQLLEWDEHQLEFTLREDDFLYEKLGSLKPACAPVKFTGTHQTERIARVVKEEFPKGFPKQEEPLFHFVEELSAPGAQKTWPAAKGFSPRIGYSYFALYGDPLMDATAGAYPDALLDKLAQAGMDSVWIHIVLSKLVEFPWDASLSQGHATRLANLKKLADRAAQRGIRIFLYLNEPRSMPLSFFGRRPELKGVVNGGQAMLCTSHPDVQAYITSALAAITRQVPNLGGFFSITASENRTNCWSHNQGAGCPRCGKRGAAAVIGELNGLYHRGIQQGGGGPQLIVWDWGWQKGWAEQIIPSLPKSAMLMSVSEWDIDITRGGVKSRIGEYSISTVGPGPRALRHWELAKAAGLKTVAKIQAGNTWEIAAVPYIPALGNVAAHAANLRNAGVNGLMLGWTLGGYPSPNLAVVAEIGSNPSITAEQAMAKVAQERYGVAGPAVVKAWQAYSTAFSEFPFGGGLYYSPTQAGPSNLLWEQPTGYSATMVGLPYDDLAKWCGHYPPEVLAAQFTKIADGFKEALHTLEHATMLLDLQEPQKKLLFREMSVAETVNLHFRSVANQVKFILERNKKEAADVKQLSFLLRVEIILAKRMMVLQSRNSTLGFEASNHYFYTPADLAEKVLNCRDLLDRWLPAFGKTTV